MISWPPIGVKTVATASSAGPFSLRKIACELCQKCPLVIFPFVAAVDCVCKEGLWMPSEGESWSASLCSKREASRGSVQEDGLNMT